MLCLTYDDGPGKNTYEIAQFLFEQNIQATFFVVGKYAFHHQDVLKKIAGLGHLIGNHTYDHPDMPFYLSLNGDLPNQILRTDAVIRKYIKEDVVYVRSPYGKWSPEVAYALNENILTASQHLGPIHWDIGGLDCYYWRQGRSVEDTVEKYLQDIEENGKGIVVMHDEIADMNFLKTQNKTLQLTQQLIPLLKERGYQFVRLDQIESIKKEALKTLKFTLRSANSRFISVSPDDDRTLVVTGKRNDTRNQITLEELGYGKVALKAFNSLYFSLNTGEGNTIQAVSKEIRENETFDLIPLSRNQIALRAYTGDSLVQDQVSFCG